VRIWREPLLPADHRPVFVLGQQKSGTSAIAGLLGEYTAATATIDLPQEIQDLTIPRIEAGEATIDQLINRNRNGFAAAIVKHPELTLIYPHLRQRFPTSRFVNVIRDPRDNIRSILDRVGLGGELSEIDANVWEQIPRPWKLVLGGGDQRPTDFEHLDALCARWNWIADQYLANADEMELIRYEDFIADKAGSIAALARALGLPERSDITASLDRPFQPPGVNRHVDVALFFGTNLDRIERACAVNMDRFGYKKRTITGG
jgi:hypothetical protein